MIALSYTQSTVYLLEIKKELLGGISIHEAITIQIGKNEHWIDVLKKTISLKNEEVFFVIPESETYIQRILLPSNIQEDAVLDYIDKETKSTIPIPLSQRIYEIGQISDTELMYITAKKQTLLSHLEELETLQAHAVFALPQSMGVYEIIKHTIKEDAIAVYIHKEKDNVMVSGIDTHGPLFSTPVTMSDPQNSDTIQTLLKTTERHHKKTVTKAFSSTDEHNIVLDIPFHDMDILIHNAIISNKIHVKQSITVSAACASNVGLALMYLKGDSINLVNQDNIAILIDEVDAQERKKESRHNDEEHTTDVKSTNHLTEESPSNAHDAIAHTQEAITHTHKQISWKMVASIALILIILVGGLVVGNQYMITQQQAKQEEQARQEAEVKLTEKPETSPTPLIDKADMAIYVLNGTGQAGVANKAQAYLEEQGYEDIETGNADAFEYQDTVISLKEDKEEYRDILEDDLGEEYTISTESATLDDDEEYDAIIIIGEEK